MKPFDLVSGWAWIEKELWYCKYLLAEIDRRKWQIVLVKSQPLICAAAQIGEHKPEKVLPM